MLEASTNWRREERLGLSCRGTRHTMCRLVPRPPYAASYPGLPSHCVQPRTQAFPHTVCSLVPRPSLTLCAASYPGLPSQCAASYPGLPSHCVQPHTQAFPHTVCSLVPRPSLTLCAASYPGLPPHCVQPRTQAFPHTVCSLVPRPSLTLQLCALCAAGVMTELLDYNSTCRHTPIEMLLCYNSYIEQSMVVITLLIDCCFTAVGLPLLHS